MNHVEVKGVIVPMVTPITPGGECDARAVRRLVDRLIESGVDAVMAAGTTGESLALSPALRRSLVEATCEAVGGRIPVIIGVGAVCLEDVLSCCCDAERAGADVVALHPPPYFPMDQSSMRKFYETVLESCSLPMSLYTIPSFAVNELSPELAERLSAHEKVIALKDSTGDEAYRREVIKRCGIHGVGVCAGDEFSFVDSVREGAVGIVPSTANLYPEDFVGLWSLCSQGRWDEASEAQAKLNHHVTKAVSERGGWLGMMRWLKQSLAEEGVCGPDLASMFSGDDSNPPLGVGVKTVLESENL